MRPTAMNLTADNRDKYRLYTLAFQQPHIDVGFCDALFRQRNGRVPRILREDFCGTGFVACEWVGIADDRFAIGVDIDLEPLTWCQTHLLSALPQHCRDRIELIHADVISATVVPVDIILALNASFCAFKHRKQLLDYFRTCHGTLEPDGVFVLGLYAGPEAQMVGADEIQCDGFVAIWEQSSFNAVTNEAVNRIHFTFPHGHSIIDAFVYDWRIWTPRELTDALRDAGFCETCVYSRTRSIYTQGRIEGCQTANISTYWDVFVVGFK